MLDHTREQIDAHGRTGPALAVSFARSAMEILEAQRLRYRIFAEEMGARVPGATMGIDCDQFDAAGLRCMGWFSLI